VNSTYFDSYTLVVILKNVYSNVLVGFPMTSRDHRNMRILGLVALLVAAIGVATPPSASKNEQSNQSDQKVLIIGDSIVAGQGDDKTQNGLEGRLNSRGSSRVGAFALSGATSKGLSLYVAHQLERNSDLRQRITESDIIIISAGINDFWAENGPRRTAASLRRLAQTLRCSPHIANGATKHVAVATLVPTTLPAQALWADTVNRQILQFPAEEVLVGPRLNQLPIQLIGPDGLHPSTRGYAWITDRTEDFLKQLKALPTSPPTKCGIVIQEGTDMVLAPFKKRKNKRKALRPTVTQSPTEHNPRVEQPQRSSS